MTALPLVGITGRRNTASLLGAPAGFSDAPLDIYFAEYATSVRSAGGLPVFVPLDVPVHELIPRLDALLIAGGEDVDPANYRAERAPETGASHAGRDELELRAVRLAADAGMPVLGICRGQQVINVAFGGALVQHLDPADGETHLPSRPHRADRTHDVTLVPGSRHARLYGERIRVNSFHHQAVDRLGDGLTIAGRAGDGVVEAIEHERLPILGVQWHPETFGGDPAFDWLVQSAATMREDRS